MENLIFSLNATVPVFLMMALGLLFRKIGWIDEDFATKLSTFVFRIPLPLMLFHDLASVDFVKAWNTSFVLFCFLATVVSILISYGISCLWKDKDIQGEFIQSSYRSSSAILGIAFIQNIYGTSGMAPLMILASVPLYNVMAVTVLSFFKPGEERRVDKKVLKKTLIGILKNPIILGIAAGLVWSLLKLPMPGILNKVTDNLGNVATPMGLLAMGAGFDIRKAFARVKPAVTASVIKLLGFTSLFLPLAAACGFRDEEMVAILVMLGSSTTVAGYVMAKNMGHEGVLTASIVMLTTMFSAFTLTFWLFLLKSFRLI